jgi:hypothetical protein
MASQPGVSVDDAIAVAYAASVDRCFQQLLVRSAIVCLVFGHVYCVGVVDVLFLVTVTTACAKKTGAIASVERR